MPKARLEEPVTFPVAARQLGWKPDDRGSWHAAGRRLRRLVIKRERQAKTQFAIRDVRGRPWQVTLGALRRYLPELQPARTDVLAAELRGMLEELRERVRDMVSEEFDRRMGERRGREAA